MTDADHRTPEQVRMHYEVEKELAGRLRNASRQERRSLYTFLYNELFRRVPHHPQLTRKASPEEKAHAVSQQIRFLGPFLRKEYTFLELGPGDCSLSFEATKLVNRVYAVDVSDEITRHVAVPNNFQLILSDGCSIPVPKNSVNVAYSNQLMEHLHPDDAFEQLQNIYDALAPGGVFVCITPNRLTGPHDISKFFDKVASGFHLKEYTVSEVRDLFRRAGFSRIRMLARLKGACVTFPVSIAILFGQLLRLVPYSWRRPIAGIQPFKALLAIRIIGIK
jgi:SAM-dependent methyltransferase